MKALKDTMGPDGLLPTLLVYGALQRLPMSDHESSTQKMRMKALEVARREYELIVSQRYIAEALRARLP